MSCIDKSAILRFFAPDLCAALEADCELLEKMLDREVKRSYSVFIGDLRARLDANRELLKKARGE